VFRADQRLLEALLAITRSQWRVGADRTDMPTLTDFTNALFPNQPEVNLDIWIKTLALLDTQKVTYYRLSDPRQVWVKVDPAVLPRDDFYTKFQVDPFPMAGDMLPIALGITLLDPEKPAVVFGSLRGIYRLRASPDSLLNLTDHTFGAVVRSQPTFALTSTHRVLEGAAPFVYPNAGIANGYVVPLEALTNNPAAAEAFKAVAIPNLIGPQD
jgi:hypothetical protein